MSLLNGIFSWLVTKRIQQFDYYRTNPIELQQETLFKLLQSSRETEWGKKFDYSSINTKEDYASRVPIQDYNSLKPYINRIKEGEQNILWHSPIKWFAKSSGTTQDKSKFIPVSKEAVEECHFRGGKDVLAIYARNYPENKIINGKSLVLGGSHQINSITNDSYFGDLSAVLIQNLPFWAHFIRTPDITIALMDEWEEKIEKMANSTVDVNVTSIAGVPSWTLVLLRKILSITGKKSICEVWPNLELYMHGGVNFSPYREQFMNIIANSKCNYIETYNASEGFFAIQDNPLSEDMMLMLDLGIYYEFIPMDKFHTGNAPVLSLGEIEKNVNYAMVISTNSGLWRYVIGDTVMFTSTFPYKIKITGRILHFINAFGEELIVDNAEQALKIACERTGAAIREYTAAPVYMHDKSKGAHQWLIEFEKNPNDIHHFTELLDIELKSVNSDYEAKRYKNMALEMPLITVVKEGVFYQWLKSKGKLGGQHKVPRLSNDRTIIDEILKLNE